MKSRFTEEEVRRIVQESRSEGVAIAASLHGVSEQTLYNWRKRFGIADGSLRVGELKRLQEENARLKRLVAERDLEIDFMKEVAGEKNAMSVTKRLAAGLGTPWSEESRSAVFAGFCDELGVENKA